MGRDFKFGCRRGRYILNKSPLLKSLTLFRGRKKIKYCQNISYVKLLRDLYYDFFYLRNLLLHELNNTLLEHVSERLGLTNETKKQNHNPWSHVQNVDSTDKYLEILINKCTIFV